MIDGNYDTFTEADRLTLRLGRCNHRPIFISEKEDGTAILTCGEIAKPGSMLLFIADALDSSSLIGQAKAPNH